MFKPQAKAELGHLPTVYQLAWALRARPLGRRTIAEKTGITEMTVRTHLGKLRRAGLVKMAKAGTSLTARGFEAFSQLFTRVRWVGTLKLEELALDRCSAAALLAGFKAELRESWRYRDAAVREGATGALLLVRESEGWAFSEQCLPLRERYPDDAFQIEMTLPQAESEDALIIAFAPEPQKARSGLWQMIAQLLPVPYLTSQREGG